MLSRLISDGICLEDTRTMQCSENNVSVGCFGLALLEDWNRIPECLIDNLVALTEENQLATVLTVPRDT